jgi:peptidyl-prolyl cis-trans isomerase SurA
VTNTVRHALAALVVLATTWGHSVQAVDKPLLIDRIIAVVGQDVVMLSDLRKESIRLATRLREQGESGATPDSVKQGAFDALILKKLQLAEAERLGIQADEQTVNTAVAAVADNNGLTVPQLRDALAAEGMDYDAFRASLREELLLRRLQNREVMQKIEVTTSEVDSYLERSGGVEGRTAVKLLYILIAPSTADAKDREAARLEAEQVIERIRSGTDFRTLARQHSSGQGAEQGGDLGWIRVNDMPELFQPYVATMQVGELKGPIAAGAGFHILQLEDVRTAGANIVRQTQARHILVRTNEVTSDIDARSRLERLRERIVNGDDFDTLARSHSDDKASAINGGDLGWTSPGNMVPAFEEQMEQLEVGEVSQPFKTEFGWHIVQVLGRRDYDATDEIRRDQARQAVRDEKAEEALEMYLRQLRDEAYIELRIEDIYQ